MTAPRCGEPARSLHLLTSATPYEKAYPDAIYVRGLALLRMHKSVEAAAEFQKIVSNKGANWGATWVHPYWGQHYALSYLAQARGYTLEGDIDKAKNAFQEFFQVRRIADPDVPVLKQAKADYVVLK